MTREEGVVFAQYAQTLTEFQEVKEHFRHV